jgi:hypothetical protein
MTENPNTPTEPLPDPIWIIECGCGATPCRCDMDVDRYRDNLEVEDET